jgi:hypothetical protein
MFYSSDDIFRVLEQALDTSQDTITNIHTSTQLLMILVNIIQANSIQGRKSTLEYDLFRTILALPLFLVNLGKMEPSGTNWRPPKDMYVTGYLANDVYRVTIKQYALYTFVVLTLVLLVWAGAVSVHCIREDVTPNLSDFPEIDFGSKVAALSSEGVEGNATGVLLKRLGNGRSCDIVERVKEKRMYVGVSGQTRADDEDEDIIKDVAGTVGLFTSKPEQRLQVAKKYA